METGFSVTQLTSQESNKVYSTTENTTSGERGGARGKTKQKVTGQRITLRTFQGYRSPEPVSRDMPDLKFFHENWEFQSILHNTAISGSQGPG